MTFSKQILLLLSIFFFLPLLNASDPKPCYTSSCVHGNFDGKIHVRFPFWLFPKQPESCGHTGFNLLCTNHHETTLKLPNSETFLVRDIDYLQQRIRLNDPKNCLARRLLSFDASGSPFSPLHLLNYAFLTCPKEDVNSSLYKPIQCLGNSTTSFIATRLDLVASVPPSCKIFKKLLLPVSEPIAYMAGFAGDLKANWRCGSVNNITLQAQCFSSVNSGSTAWFSDTCGHDLISHDGRRPPSAFVEVQVGDTRRFASKLIVKLATDQTYHVFDECSQYCSDYRPFAKGLWPGVLGKLEVGILGATGLTPMKNSQFQRHAYTVAKYGNKWARTRTVVNNASPKWNEQCSWDIYEKCTVFTIGLYDNHQLVVNSGLDDVPIGKVRIPLSKLDWNKIYTGSFPILVLGKEGLKKTGEIQLAIRCAIPPPAWLFFSPSYFLATSPFRWMLPKSHYKAPLGLLQYEDLRSKAVEVICFNLNKTVPKLRNEVVKDMLKPRSKRFSMRRTIANFERLCRFFMWLYGPYAWLDANLVSTTDVGRKAVTFGVCFLLVVGHRFFLWLLVDWWLYAYIGGVYILYRVYKLRTVAFNMIMNRSNPATPLVLVDLKLSKLDSPNLDILDEEFDSMPSSESDVYVLRMRYDRMRKMGEKIMLLVGDFASQCERLQASWRLCTDHIVVVICLVFLGYGVLRLLQSETEYVFKSVLLLFISYWLKFPWHRYGLPSATKNYIRRFSSHEDLIIT
ncbi:unnamed protein product [Microthlaspi erraticum]|uniref:C2 domain-containing protein n=1 Tax=Microthlaspi erraticum TaxID=1685480 RepID=A0A6D2I440_9BRAS|nr:unnamed protein product [Microthlaspi erraticum]